MKIAPASTLLDLLQGAQIVWAERREDGITLVLADGRHFLVIGEFDIAFHIAGEKLH